MYFDDDILLDKIEDYLRGKLPPAEAADLDRQMAADPELAETVAAMRALQEGIEFSFQKELREKLEAWEQASPLSELAAASPPPKVGKWVWIAAFLIVLGGGIWFFWPKPAPPPAPGSEPTQEPTQQDTASSRKEPAVQVPSQPTPVPNTAPPTQPEKKPASAESPAVAALSARYYALTQPDFCGDNKSGSLPASDSPLAKGMALYCDSVAFKKAIAEFRKVESSDKGYALAQLWEAHARYRAEDFAQAADIFKRLAEQAKYPTARTKHQWFEALCLLRDYGRQKARADALLSQLAEPGQSYGYQAEAAAIQQELRKIFGNH